MKKTTPTSHKILPLKSLACYAAAALAFTSAAQAQSFSAVFGSNDDGQAGFTHTAIDNTNTFLTEGADSVTYRNQSTGTVDAAFLRNGFGIDRTADSGKTYTVSGTFTINDGYADDNNRIGLLLFTDPTTALDRNNTGQLGIIWNTDDRSTAGSPGSNDSDFLAIYNGYNSTDADGAVTPVLRDQTTPFAQDILQGTDVTFSATFFFTGADINITASMTDIGGTTVTSTAVVLAADYTGEYFGFASVFRARNYDGDPDPTGAARDNPLVLDYQTFSLTTSVPEPSAFALLSGLLSLGFVALRRRQA